MASLFEQFRLSRIIGGPLHFTLCKSRNVSVARQDLRFTADNFAGAFARGEAEAALKDLLRSDGLELPVDRLELLTTTEQSRRCRGAQAIVDRQHPLSKHAKPMPRMLPGKPCRTAVDSLAALADRGASDGFHPLLVQGQPVA